MNQFINIFFTLLFGFGLSLTAYSQSCGDVQTLTEHQKSEINSIRSFLDTALKNEDLFQIDSLSSELVEAYSTEAGKPDAAETYYTLVSDTDWLDLNSAVELSRLLVAKDSMVYVDLWKAAKGMKPPSYEPNSLFLRASAEIASGLLKIADKESDVTRKTLYQSWATRALDSLATMQLPDGSFPFPDLRDYNDPVFGPIIQNFLNYCGADSVNVLQNGWIIDDKGLGEFKFDAGVIANAYYEAYQYTGNGNYKDIAVAIGDYLKPLKFNLNYNYNTFASLGLTRAYQLSNDTSYLNRAVKNIRYGVFPGQLANGRWLDGHNANSRYHSIIIQNIIPTIQLLPETEMFKDDLEMMSRIAIQNMVDYTYRCGSATGYRWLLKAHQVNSPVLPEMLKDSISGLIGRHIRQSSVNGKYLDIPVLGEYIELFDQVTSFKYVAAPGLEVNIYPNPTTGNVILAFNGTEQGELEISLFSLSGTFLIHVEHGKSGAGISSYKLDLSPYPPGVFILRVKSQKGEYVEKIVKSSP